MHGFALNLDPDLSLFRLIVPCGIREHGVSSVARLAGTAPSVRDAAEEAFLAFGELLGRDLAPFEDVSGEPLEAVTRALLSPPTSGQPTSGQPASGQLQPASEPDATRLGEVSGPA